MVARLDVGDIGADLFDDAGGLVAEDGRATAEGRAPLAVDEVEVGVADAAGRGADEHLGRLRVADLNVVDFEYVAVAVLGLCSRFPDGSFHRSSLPRLFTCNMPRGFAGLAFMLGERHCRYNNRT